MEYTFKSPKCKVAKEKRRRAGFHYYPGNSLFTDYRKYKTIYAYPFVFFPMFHRFFSLVFGGFGKQDEARISAIPEIGTYTFAILVLLVFFLVSISGQSYSENKRQGEWLFFYD